MSFDETTKIKIRVSSETATQWLQAYYKRGYYSPERYAPKYLISLSVASYLVNASIPRRRSTG
jgi:hypothetical protein